MTIQSLHCGQRLPGQERGGGPGREGAEEAAVGSRRGSELEGGAWALPECRVGPGLSPVRTAGLPLVHVQGTLWRQKEAGATLLPASGLLGASKVAASTWLSCSKGSGGQSHQSVTGAWRGCGDQGSPSWWVAAQHGSHPEPRLLRVAGSPSRKLPGQGQRVARS